MEITLTHAFADIANQLTTLAARQSGDLRPVMESIGNLLENTTRKRFETKTSPAGEAWPTWAETTQQERRKSRKVKNKTKSGYHFEKYGEPLGELMIDGRTLVDSLTHFANNDRVLVGTAEQYAIYHQEGTKQMPARPFLGLSDQDIVDILDLLSNYLADSLE